MGKNKYITSRILSTLQDSVECRDSYMLTI